MRVHLVVITVWLRLKRALMVLLVAGSAQGCVGGLAASAARASLKAESRLRTNGDGVAELDAKNGFRDLRFGALVQELKGLTKCRPSGASEEMCTRPDDSLELGGARLDDVTYQFHGGWLYAVLLRATGGRNAKALLDALQESYGQGYRPNRYMDEYLWYGDEVSMSYDYSEVTREVTVFISNNKLVERKRGEEKAKARDANL